MDKQELFELYFNKGLRMKIFEHKDRIKYYEQYLKGIDLKVIINDIILKL